MSNTLEVISFQWIEFAKIADTGKTTSWICKNKESNFIIGYVKWYPAWRKYSFFPGVNTVFETQCLKDIVSFIEHLMRERKAQKQNASQP